MPGYGKKLSDKEMWQIVTYVRALQKMDRVSNQERNKLNQKVVMENNWAKSISKISLAME